MKKVIRCLLVPIILVMSLNLGGCAKIWESEQIEIQRCPPIGIDHEVPGWDLQDTNKINP